MKASSRSVILAPFTCTHIDQYGRGDCNRCPGGSDHKINGTQVAVCVPTQLISPPQVTSHSLSLYSAMAFTIAHAFVLEVLNVYCMVPLIWWAYPLYV